MKTVTSTEAKAKFSALLRDAERGEIIEITHHGRVVARLAAPVEDEAARRRAAVEGLMEWRKTLSPTGMTIQDILSARDEGRK